MAAVEGSAVRLRLVVKDRVRFFDGDEPATSVLLPMVVVVEEAEQGQRSVELAVAAGEAGIGEEVLPL